MSFSRGHSIKAEVQYKYKPRENDHITHFPLMPLQDSKACDCANAGRATDPVRRPAPSAHLRSGTTARASHDDVATRCSRMTTAGSVAYGSGRSGRPPRRPWSGADRWLPSIDGVAPRARRNQRSTRPIEHEPGGRPGVIDHAAGARVPAVTGGENGRTLRETQDKGMYDARHLASAVAPWQNGRYLQVWNFWPSDPESSSDVCRVRHWRGRS